ncbi:hypothetical protein EU523_01040 [Candidatus Heimdallarchaeota archaeon]|nr:MAG: hypothetical protein EU523_01040 [Candidatus Heimdallarchaeota archaeon]
MAVSTNYLYITIIGLSVGIFAYIVDVLLLNKYFKRKKPATLSLTITIFSLGSAALVLGVFSLVTYLEASEIELYNLGIDISYILITIGSIALFNFALQIFAPRKNWVRLVYSIIGGIVIGLLFSDIIPLESENFRTQIIEFVETKASTWKVVMMLVLAITAFIVLLVYTLQESRKVEFLWEKRGFQLISLFAISGILSFVLLALDSVLEVIIDDFTQLLYYLGLAITVPGFIFAYLGYIYPAWLRNIFREKEEKAELTL